MKRRIEPAACPSGLVFVLFAGDAEVERVPLGVDDAIQEVAEEHADRYVDGSIDGVAIYDGDTGELCVVIHDGTTQGPG